MPRSWRGTGKRLIRLRCLNRGLLTGLHGWKVVRVEDAADNDRLVWISFEEGDDNFIADLREEIKRAIFPGIKCANTNPAGAVGVILAFAIPVKLNFYAPVFVSEYFLASRTGHVSGLRAMNDRFWGQSRRTEGKTRRDAEK